MVAGLLRMDENELTLRETARGIAIRAGVLAVGGILLSGIVAAEALKAAGVVVKIATGTAVLLIGSGMAAWEVKRMHRHLSAPPTEPAPAT